MLSRRAFVAAVGQAAALGATVASAGASHGAPPGLRCFDPAAAAFIVAACECFIPATPASPGATAAGVAARIDAQLYNGWRWGQALVHASAWQSGAPLPRRPTTLSPARYFASAARAIQRNLAPDTAFERLPARAQRRLLETLIGDDVDLDGVSSRDFLDALLTLTVAAYFAHPAHAPTRDRIAWPMSAFPGSHAAVSSQVS